MPERDADHIVGLHETGAVHQIAPEGSAAFWAAPARVAVSVVVPVYNSQHTLTELIDRLHRVLASIRRSFEIVLVDDGSLDESWAVLRTLKGQYPTTLRIARLLRNSGQHNAILCGFSLARGDAVVTMDDDLQNPPEEIPRLLEAVDRGYDLAIGAYDSKKHSSARNAGSGLVDQVLRRVFDVPRDFQFTSFRVIRHPVVASVSEMGGAFPYITAMLFSNASKYVNVPVRHDPRRIGTSNYNFNRSVRLAFNLVLNYSSYPLTLIAAACAAAFLFALLYGGYVAFRALSYGTPVPGWSATIVVLSFFSGISMLCMAVLALYISRINQQVTRTRRTYIIGEIHE